MATLYEIPVNRERGRPSLRMRTLLDQVELLIDLDWNTRMERWHASFYDADEKPLLMGIPLNVNTEIFSRFKIEGLPPGKLVLFDSQNRECGLEDLGDRCKLYYRSEL
jgi:hypothetical protein